METHKSAAQRTSGTAGRSPGDLDVNAAIDAATRRLSATLTSHFRHLHASPELSWQERKTAAYIGSTLSSLGLDPRPVAGTGWVVDLPGGDSRGRRALRSDHDAVAVGEATGLPYASRLPGVAHACGHDAHTSILLTVAAVLMELRPEPRRPLRLIFQPAEEALDSGAGYLLEEGVLDGVEDIIGLHVWPSLPSGRVGLRQGVVSAAADCWECVLRGPGGHGARPHETADLVSLAARLVIALTDLPRRQLDPLKEPAVVTATQIEGGHTFNVIPREVRVRGTARTLAADVRHRLTGFMETTCRDLAEAHRAEVDWTLSPGPPLLVNDARLVRRAEELLPGVLGTEGVVAIEHPSLGSEDFSKFTERVPGLLLRLGCTAAGQVPHPLHSCYFRVDEAALETGVRAMCRLAVD